MLFNDPGFFLVFLPLCVLAFYLVAGRLGFAWGCAVLSIFSLVFYSWWRFDYLFLLLGSVLVNFLIGRRLGAAPSRALLIAGIAANLLLLGYYKYTGFFISVARDLGAPLPGYVDVLLPLGISFFTFQQIAFLVDCHRREVGAVPFGRYLLFVTFFPQLIAGPIVHHAEMMPQFAARRALHNLGTHLVVGTTIFAIGLFKKVGIADTMASFATPVFAAADAGAPVTLFEAWGGTIAYAFQIYFDFSAYSDMATGMAFMFGVRLPLNFNSPYQATSIIDFWRRWHITLSRFLRDHLYIPLGGSRRGFGRQLVNVMVVMGLGGLWHGAGWTFVIWGGLHGAYLLVNLCWRRLVPSPARPRALRRFAGWSLTMPAVLAAWVFFRAKTLAGALGVLHGMIGLNGIAAPDAFRGVLARLLPPGVEVRPALVYVSTNDVILLAILIGALTLVVTRLPNLLQIFQSYRPTLAPPADPQPGEGRPWAGWRAWTEWRFSPVQGLAVGVMIFVVARSLLRAAPTEFLYFNF